MNPCDHTVGALHNQIAKKPVIRKKLLKEPRVKTHYMQKNKNKNYRVSLGQKLSMPEDNGETSLKS